jgi:hypothetical protein
VDTFRVADYTPGNCFSRRDDKPDRIFGLLGFVRSAKRINKSCGVTQEVSIIVPVMAPYSRPEHSGQVLMDSVKPVSRLRDGRTPACP